MLFLMVLLTTAIFTFAYHYERNGNPFAIGDTKERIAWSFTFGAGYLLFTSLQSEPFIFGWYVIGSFIAIVIPHAFAQNAGHRTITWNEQPWTKWWPGAAFYYVKNFYVQDFFGMMCTGLLRGIVVFLPAVLLGASLIGALLAVIVTAVWQPASYWAGYKVPFAIWTNAARSSQWGEFFIPIGWAVALLVSTKF